MIDDYGPEGFRKLVEARLGFALEDLAEFPLPDAESDHMGIHEQKSRDATHAGFPVRLGPDDRAADAGVGAIAGELSAATSGSRAGRILS